MSTRTDSQIDSILYATKANMFQKTQDIATVLATGYSDSILQTKDEMIKQSNVIFTMTGSVGTNAIRSVAADYSISNSFNRALPSGYVQNNYWYGY